jgi:hypothetical protein
MTDNRDRKADRRRTQTLSTPEARAQWRRTHRLRRYGLTQEDFDRILEAQGHACAMCLDPFEEDEAVFIDHDHACCPEEKRSCGKCRRGLLCLRCNTGLGYIERMHDMARHYLDRYPPSGRPAGIAETA